MFDVLTGSQGKGDRVHGWIADEMTNVDFDNANVALIEADPKYGFLSDGQEQSADKNYVKHRKGDHFVFVKNVKPIRNWKRGVPENTGYKLHKARKKGSIRIGDQWITPIQEDDSVL